MSFLETPTFPTDIAYGSRGGPTYSTTLVILDSGFEQRNINWSYPRHQYDVSYGVRTEAQLESLITFFHAVRGRAHGFRFKDHRDYQSCAYGGSVDYDDQTIGTGNGVTETFQLIKTYTKGSLSQVRQIKKPIANTVRVGVGGTEQSEGDDFTVDTATGIITFLTSPPPTGTITAGFQFHVPCRFDTDQISVEYADYQLAATSIMIMELRV